MHYQEYAPAAQLSSIVHCVWTLEGHARELEAGAQPILPDGRPELILHFGNAFERVHESGAVERQPGLIFAGQLTDPLVLQPTGRVAVLGVRFHADGAAAVLREPQHAMVGLTLDVEALAPSLARALRDARDRAGCPTNAVRTVQESLTRRSDPLRIDPRVRSVIDDIRRHRGLIGVNELARRAGLTRRHLERCFRRSVGLSPKRLARITRFQRALRMLAQLDSRQRGTLTAGMCGYADQPHFIRDFRELAGCAPEAHLLRRAELNGFFSENRPQVSTL